MHDCVALHIVLQLPQCAGSVRVSMQMVPHRVVPNPHAHALDVQLVPPRQAVEHMPQ
jgi:hypothetical protein